MGDSQSQQLTSFYVSVSIIAAITVWIFFPGSSQQRTQNGHTICRATAKPQFNLKISFNTHQAAKQYSNNNTKTAYPFQIISIIKDSKAYCKNKIGKIYPVYLRKSQQLKLQHKPIVRLNLILYANASLIKSSGITVWQLAIK